MTKITITYIIETAPPCDIEMMELMCWEFIGINDEDEDKEPIAYFMTTIES
jgi:hypothetical protein